MSQVSRIETAKMPEPLTLKDWGKRLRRLSKDNLPIVIREVIRIAENWEHYQKETDFKNIDHWLRNEVHYRRGLTWYKERFEVLSRDKKLNTRIVDRVEMPALFWLHRHSSDQEFKQAASKINERYREEKSTPLSNMQVRHICSHLTAKKTREKVEEENRRLRERIVKLEDQIRGLGAVPVK